MRRYLRTTLNPDLYHGHGRKPPFFEGWYFKLIDSTEQHRYAVIPGIFLNNDSARQHAFIQVLDGITGQASYHAFPSAQFQASEHDFDVRIGVNHFTANRISLCIDDSQNRIAGELHFENITPWPVTLAAPGIMGWYGWIPFMECYHGVVSLDHTLRGALTVNGRQIDFTGGQGYIEKDWGKSFPSGYVWMQTNHFEISGVCLTASIAMIPSIGRTFRGFIIGFWHDGILHRFATYTGAKVEKLAITDDHVLWVVQDRQHRLEMSASRAVGGLLFGPARTEMHRRVDETLKASIDVRLTSLKNKLEIFSGTGRNAGLEVHGDLQTLLNTP